MNRGAPPRSHAGAAARLVDAALLLLTGAPVRRGETVSLEAGLRLPVPLSCRALVVPTAPGCGATTVALHLAASLTRARRLPGLVLSASTGEATAADHLPQANPWSPAATAESPLDAESIREAVGAGEDGLLGCLRLPAWTGRRPDAWEDARTRLFRFYDTIVTETAVLPADDVLDASRHHHAVVAVTPARRRDVERTRRLLASLRTRIEADATGPMARRPARLLHAVVVSSPRRPLIPPLHRDERLIPYDDVLALTSPGVTAPPGLLRRRTAVALTRLAADVVGAATAEEMTAS